MVIVSLTDIAKDFTIPPASGASKPNEAFFRVKCRLATTALKLQNGYETRLQKGMTLQAGFVVTRRTLSQLLFDKVEDWLNPNRTEASPHSATSL
ncbi:hypothetical protein [Runella slithyformis]|uniref:hypothetical protein n=1 Tax=Runella slithyformis TaxID=106 RepID=UPI0002DD08C8|nr:hypothetical protein [Runella slithyformis]